MRSAVSQSPIPPNNTQALRSCRLRHINRGEKLRLGFCRSWGALLASRVAQSLDGGPSNGVPARPQREQCSRPRGGSQPVAGSYTKSY